MYAVAVVPGYSDCVMITQWRIVGNHVEVQFRASDDREFIQQRYQTWTTQGLHFSKAFQTARRGRVVGQKTNGSTGQPLFIKLPAGGGARICTKRDTYPDGREFVGVGCIPEVEVEPTRKDIAAGRDAVLEKAIDVLRSQIQ